MPFKIRRKVPLRIEEVQYVVSNIKSINHATDCVCVCLYKVTDTKYSLLVRLFQLTRFHNSINICICSLQS